jgi:hypothetical protein
VSARTATLAITPTHHGCGPYRAPMGKIVLSCVLALVFGFVGAAGAVVAFHDQLRGVQGPTGLAGAPGALGPAGKDGTNGQDGARGPRGRPGRPGKVGRAAAKSPTPVTDIGTNGCAGSFVDVVTRANLTANQRLIVVTKPLCIVKPSTP